MLPSLYVPVAVQPRVDAGARTALGGVTAIETSVAELTVKGADPVTPLSVALMLAVPGDTPVTRLTDPTVATAVLSEVQLASRVMFWVLESSNVPVAAKDNFDPGAMVRPKGVTEIDTSVALDTVRVTEALSDPSVAVMVDVPGARPLARPLLAPTLATPVLEEVHVACDVRSCVLPSEKVPIAENCSLVPAAIVTLPGWIAKEARSAALTVAVTLPLIEPEAAVIVVVPRLRAVARPLTVIDATLVFDEVQVTVAVMSCVVPSEKVPVAVNCCRVPSGMDALVGVTAMEVRLALVTVRVAVEKTLPEVAVMIEVPAATPRARPGTPLTLMVATAGLPEVHWTEPVMFCTLPSEKVPVAVN